MTNREIRYEYGTRRVSCPRFKNEQHYVFCCHNRSCFEGIIGIGTGYGKEYRTYQSFKIARLHGLRAQNTAVKCTWPDEAEK